MRARWVRDCAGRARASTRAKTGAASGGSQPGRDRPCGRNTHVQSAVKKLVSGRSLGGSARQQCRTTMADTHIVTAFAPRIRGCAPAGKSRGDITVFMRTKPGRKDVARSGQRRIKTSYIAAWGNVQGRRIRKSRAGETRMRFGCFPARCSQKFIAFAPRAPNQSSETPAARCSSHAGAEPDQQPPPGNAAAQRRRAPVRLPSGRPIAIAWQPGNADRLGRGNDPSP